MYCGDETGSFIGDIGSCTSRFGYGGEDNPKYVVPSYMAENETTNVRYIPSSCHTNRIATQKVSSIMRMSSLNGNEEYIPQIDPNAYLQQGDIVQDWDALERVWSSSFDILRVRDTLKHTRGDGNYYSANNNNKKTNDNSNTIRDLKTTEKSASTATTSASASGMKSSTLRSTSSATTSTTNPNSSSSEGKCVHPILAVLPGNTHIMNDNNTGSKYDSSLQRKQQSKYTELLLETFDAPAIFLAPSPMLSSFSFGRQTSLVVDIGAGGTRVTPIIDGLVLKHSQRRNGRGSDWISNVMWKALSAKEENENMRILRPRYQASQLKQSWKKNEDAKTPSILNKNQGIFKQSKSSIFHRWAMQDLMYELRTNITNLSNENGCINSKDNRDVNSTPFIYDRENDSKTNDSISQSTPVSIGDGDKIEAMDIDGSADNPPLENSYELPDGTLIELGTRIGKDLFRTQELLFADSMPFLNYMNHNSNSKSVIDEHHTICNLPLHKLIHSSLSSVGDCDARKDLISNIVLTGGCSLLQSSNQNAISLEQQLSKEVINIIPSMYKCRVIASRNQAERLFSPWIGASILTSLGSFQQLWLSRSEYEEYGRALSVQRFP